MIPEFLKLKEYVLARDPMGKKFLLCAYSNGKYALNGHPQSVKDYSSHAEARLLRKPNIGKDLYVIRITRGRKTFANARPCAMCRIRLKNSVVERVYYSISEDEYGILEV